MSSFHRGVNCDVCCERDIVGVRYYCLICNNYDLCEMCYNERCANLQHKAYHPMQSILPELEFLESVNQTAAEEVSIYVCPYCGDEEFNPPELLQHCKRYHLENLQPIGCPICPVYNPGGQRLLTTTLMTHLLDIHKEYCTPKSETRISSAPRPEVAECAICVERVSRTSNNRSLPCGHCFHSTCINRWLEQNPTCPVCRTAV